MAYDPTIKQIGTGLRAGSGILGGLSQVYGQGNQGALAQASGFAGGAGNAAGIIGGIQQGGLTGNASAAINAGRLANRFGVGSKAFGKGLGAAGNVLGIYNGINQGGVLGYGGAAANSAQLAGTLLSNPALSTVGGYIAAPLAVYNAIDNYQSGKTGSNALNGAEAGAAIGSIVPGLGTAIGGIIGGAVGAFSSAFGPGAKDPETSIVQHLIDATGQYGNNPAVAASVKNPYLELAGLMDRRESTLPMYQQYGRMGEEKFSRDLAGKINQAITADPSLRNDPNAVYSKVVDPWVESMGSGYKNVGPEYAATTKGLLQGMTQQYLSGQAGNNWKSIGDESPFETIYTGSPITAAAATPEMGSQALINPASRGSRRSAALKATGGNVSNNLKARLRDLRAGSSANRKTHFDDGGDVDYGGFDSTAWDGNYGDTISSQYTPDTPDYSGFVLPNDTQENLQQSLTDNTPSQGYDLNGNVFNVNENANPTQSTVWNTSDLDQALQGSDSIVNNQNDPSGVGATSNSSFNSALSSLGSLLRAGAPLAPILASLLSKNKGSGSAPGTAAGYGAIAPIQTPSFNRQSIANPTNSATGAPMTQKDWYTYGERPEANFFSNNAVPYVPGVSPASSAPTAATAPTAPAVAPATPANVPTTDMAAQPVMYAPTSRMQLAEGGALSQSLGASGPGISRHITGAGNGTSDDIDAKLSDGEYVIDANTVSLLGNGSNKAGAEALDRLRENLRKHAAKPMAKGKQFMKAKPPENYLRGGSK